MIVADAALLPRSTAVTLSEETIDELVGFAAELARRAAPSILAHFRQPIVVADKASGNEIYDPVTEADRGAETVIRTLITERYPQHGIYGEEHGFEPGVSGLTWVVDPIDGTRSFITGQLNWATLIGLFDGERAVLGAVHQPYTGELFLGRPGAAWMERGDTRRELRTRQCGSLSAAVLYTTHPQLFTTPAERAAFQMCAARAQLQRYGGDCYSYCMLAHGLVDVVVESSLYPYDVQALIQLIEAAGGVITDWRGGPATMGGRVAAAGDPRVHAEVLSILAMA